MQLLQLIETILVVYCVFVGAIALTIYIVSVCLRFVRESRKKDK